MIYRIRFTPRANRKFRDLPRAVQVRLTMKIDGLSVNPRPNGSKKLNEEDALYRIRVGDYRVVCQIQDKALLVLILKVGHRRDIYLR